MAKNQIAQKDPVVSMKDELRKTIETLSLKQEQGLKTAVTSQEASQKWQKCVDYADEMLGYADGNEEATQALTILRTQAAEFAQVSESMYQGAKTHNEELLKVLNDCKQKIIDLDLMESKNALHQNLREIASTLKNPIELTTEMPEFREAEKLVFTAQALIDLKDERL